MEVNYFFFRLTLSFLSNAGPFTGIHQWRLEFLFFNFKIHLYFYTSTAVYFVLAFIVMASDELASNNFSKTIRFFYYSYREWGFIIEIINW